MKKVLFIGAMLLAGMIFSTNVVNAQQNVQQVKTYCGVKDYPDTKTTLHGYGQGDSKTLEGARLRAELDAQKRLASKIQSLVKRYVESKLNDFGVEEDGEVISMVRQISSSISEQVISDVSTVCEENLTYNSSDPNGGIIYRCFMTIELDRTVLAKAAYQKLRERRIAAARETLNDIDKSFNL